jgi:hypothetical protein
VKTQERTWRTTGVLALAVLAGCGSPNLGQPATFAITPGAAFTAAEADQVYAEAQRDAQARLADSYRVLDASDAEVDVAGVGASSVRNDYFRLSYLTDGNTHSAWNPDPAETAPTVTFDLARRTRLAAMQVKLSPAGVTMDVAVALGDGAFMTVATGLAPSQYEALVQVTLPSVDADRVRVTFHHAAGQQVSVCELHWYGSEAPAATPQPSPSASAPCTCPVPTPTPKPTPKPADDCGFVVGGIGTLGGACPATVALEGAELPGKGVGGFVYVSTRGRCYVGRVDVVQRQGLTVTLSGKLCGSGQDYTLVAVGDGHSNAITFSTSEDFELSGQLRCGGVRFKHLPCKVDDVRSTCHVKRWGHVCKR